MKYLIIAAAMAVASGNAIALDMQAGRWEVTTTATMEGMPVQPQTFTQTQCMKPEDAVIEPPSEQGIACQMVENDTSGNTVKWRMDCTLEQGGTMDAQGEIAFSGDSMNGHMTLHGNVQGMNMTMKHEYKGRRVGDC